MVDIEGAAIRSAGVSLLVGAALRRIQAGIPTAAGLLLAQLLDDELTEALAAATDLEAAVLAEMAHRTAQVAQDGRTGPDTGSTPPRPRIVVLCGSTRFKDEINDTNAQLTLAGYLVISLGVFGHVDLPDRDWTTGGSHDKKLLDELHRRKIDLADEVLIVNPGGYIGDSTRGEIAYAERLGKPVRYLVPLGAPTDCV
jgi:hypothetical protein